MFIRILQTHCEIKVTPSSRATNLPLQSLSPSLIAVCIGIIAALLVFYPSWKMLLTLIGTSETYGHGVLIPFISVWLVWGKRNEIRQIQPEFSWIGFLSLLVCCVVWLLGTLASVNILIYLSIVGMVVSVVIAIAGNKIARLIAFPLGFPFLMLPIYGPLNPPLMDYTARVTIWAVRASGVPVHGDGLNFSLPTGNWSVIEECSGLHYLLAAVVLGALFAYLNFKTWTRRLLFLAVTLSFGVIANWIRAYLIVMLGHLTEMRWGIGLDHYIYGWVCFGITIFFVFALGARWRDVEPVSTASVGISNQPHSNSSARVSGNEYRFTLSDAVPLLAAIIMLAVTPWITHHFQAVTINASALKDVVSEIGSVSKESLDLQPDYQGARSTVQGTIVDGAGTEVFVAYFAAQKTGNEMVAYGNGVVAREDNLWRVLSSRDRSFTYNGRPIVVRELRVRKGSSDRLAWSWFTVGEKQVSSALYSKGLIAWAMLAGRGDHSVVSVISTPMPTIQDVNGSVELSAEIKDARIRLEKAAVPVVKGLQSFAH